MTDSGAAGRRSRRRRPHRRGAGAAAADAVDAAGRRCERVAAARPAATGPSRRLRARAPTPPTTATATKPRPSRATAVTAARPAGEARDRGLRDLIGAGPSQVESARAMRARDVNRPTDDDLAAAEAELVIVRRNWRPKT